MRAHLAARLDPVTLPAGMTTDDLAVVLLGAITGIHQQWRISPKTVDLDRVYDTLTSLLTAALGTAAVPEPAEPAEQADRPATGKRRR
nr:hypothetical protein GCM10020241_63180 [Streptoalloteichus tenebrarius]